MRRRLMEREKVWKVVSGTGRRRSLRLRRRLEGQEEKDAKEL